METRYLTSEEWEMMPTPLTPEEWALLREIASRRDEVGWSVGRLIAVHESLAATSLDIYRAVVSEHGHDEKHAGAWPACLPVHYAMNRYRDVVGP